MLRLIHEECKVYWSGRRRTWTQILEVSSNNAGWIWSIAALTGIWEAQIRNQELLVTCKAPW